MLHYSAWQHVQAGAWMGGELLLSTVTETVWAIRDLAHGQADLYQILDLLSMVIPIRVCVWPLPWGP